MKESTISFSDKDHNNHNCTIIFDDGSSMKVFADWLHNTNNDHWKGWKCDAGVNRISIMDNFDVYSGRCKNDYLGNIMSDWTLLDDNVCKRDRCNLCTDDLMIK